VLFGVSCVEEPERFQRVRPSFLCWPTTRKQPTSAKRDHLTDGPRRHLIGGP
jgi:hypothetical protein